MKLLLIRHGATAGTLEKRYIGRTDAPLCDEGIAALRELHYPRCERLICSPMLRCIQTAEILFFQQNYTLCRDLRECDFGIWEGKNYHDLNGDPVYQKWIDSGGTEPFPQGESPDAFRARCRAAFDEIMRQNQSSTAMVIHGGTIMAILSEYAAPHRDFYDWMTAPGHGWLCEYSANMIKILEKL